MTYSSLGNSAPDDGAARSALPPRCSVMPAER